MESLSLQPSRIRFPARCIQCGATPTQAIPLEIWRGIDLRSVRWGRGVEIDMPACGRCASRRLRRRIGWFAGVIGGLLALIVVAAVIAGTAGKPSQPYVFIPLGVVSVIYVFYMRSRELELYQRWFSPVWLRRFVPKLDTVEICFRDPALMRDVAALSGKPLAGAAPADFRSPAGAPPPAPWTAPPRRGLPWWVAFGTGLAMLVVGVVEWVQYDTFERTGESFRDEAFFVAIYELGGKWSVLAVFVIVGALVCAFAIAMKRNRQGVRTTLGMVMAWAIERGLSRRNR